MPDLQLHYSAKKSQFKMVSLLLEALK